MSDSQPVSTPDPGELTLLDLEPFDDIPFVINVHVGSAVRSVQEILELDIGDTIPLDRLAHQNVQLTIEGIVIGTAEVVGSEAGSSIQVSQIGGTET